jgi:excisionase family DNA binding protein
MPARDPLLTIDHAAELLGTGPRFPRRLVAERRIRFVHVGRHVRIPDPPSSSTSSPTLLSP